MISLSPNINTNRVFLINRSELEGKLEVGYYSPEINQIEKKIKSKSTKLLRDFIVRLSSGATPSIQDEAKFYSDEKNGIPFLRVQNLCTNGKLDLSNVRYINKETHENYLKRSQVSGGDLLVKITGVGRMAIASVAPEGFVGNTNQHMVVIKTKTREVSEYLASYLNLDIIEKIASRKATGATRPALDYAALKSIPIVEGLDFSLLAEAERKKEEKEAEAKVLLESIDTYLLNELGISLPEQNNTLQDRIFTAKFSEVVGGRLDPDYISKYEFLINQKAKYDFVTLGSLILKAPQYGANEEAVEPTSNDDIRYIRITDIDENGILKKTKWKTANNTSDKYLLKFNDLLFARSGSVGRCYIHKAIEKDSIFAGYLIRFIIDESRALPDYIFHYCNSSIYKFWVSAIERPAVQSNINSEEFKSLPIPLPSTEKQAEMIQHISGIHLQIEKLKIEANVILEEAKKTVEHLILGNK